MNESQLCFWEHKDLEVFGPRISNPCLLTGSLGSWGVEISGGHDILPQGESKKRWSWELGVQQQFDRAARGRVSGMKAGGGLQWVGSAQGISSLWVGVFSGVRNEILVPVSYLLSQVSCPLVTGFMTLEH